MSHIFIADKSKIIQTAAIRAAVLADDILGTVKSSWETDYAACLSAAKSEGSSSSSSSMKDLLPLMMMSGGMGGAGGAGGMDPMMMMLMMDSDDTSTKTGCDSKFKISHAFKADKTKITAASDIRAAVVADGVLGSTKSTWETEYAACLTKATSEGSSSSSSSMKDLLPLMMMGGMGGAGGAAGGMDPMMMMM